MATPFAQVSNVPRELRLWKMVVKVFYMVLDEGGAFLI